MPPKERSLRAALDRHQKKDYELERQKKLQKDASKRRRERNQKQEQDEALEEAGGVVLNAAELETMQKPESSAKAETEEDWEDEASEGDEGDEAGPEYDLSRLDDSDSDSEEDDEIGTIGEGSKKPNGHKSGGSLAEQLQSLVQANGNGKEEEEDDEEDEESDAASLAFSDLPAAEDTEDIVPHQRLTINNISALSAALKSISLPYASMTFSEHQSVTTSDPVNITDINDDLNRELEFYAQSLSAAKKARGLLKKEGAPFTRPIDYFAEMVKNDEHMGRVKAKLVDDAASKKASADARKQRDLKKFGKQVQQEKLKERAKAKKDMLEKVNILKRKRASGGAEGDREEDMFDVALEDAATTERRDREARRHKGREKGRPTGKGAEDEGPNAKRQRKNEKFGFGGKKRFSKSGDANSTGDVSGYSVKKMKGQAGKKGGSKRLGKSRREKSR